MRRLSYILCAIAFFSCNEKSPLIDFGPKASDTAFMAAVETQQQRMVLIEEFTGVTCPNCPTGQQILKSIEDANPGRIALVSAQPFDLQLANPVVDKEGVNSIHDNRTRKGTDLMNGIYGNNTTLPQAGFDRLSEGGIMLFDRSGWASKVASRLSVASKANIKVTSTYSASTGQAVIKVHVAYTGSIAIGQLLTVALIENEVVDAQEMPYGSVPKYEQNYHHQHVLRDILTPPTGTAILGDKPTKAAGQVYERTFVYKVNEAWNPDNCRIIAFVSNNDGANKEVVQAAEAHLK